MTATAASTTAAKMPRQRRPWTPDGNDHLVFDFVRLKGKPQEWVALHLEISQATVSRIVQRYERWLAHARDREAGLLDPAERLRTQRRLAFERNELILASCLRIAGNMEGFISTSKTVLEGRTPNNPEGTTRTHYEDLDRSGVAARFYRLAFRINMELVRLAEQEPPPAPPPLTPEEIAELEEQAAADTAEIEEANHKTIERFNAGVRQDLEQHREIDRLKQIEEAERVALAEEILRPRAQEPGDRSQEPEDHTNPPTSAVNNVHNLHKENGDKNVASACQNESCKSEPVAEKNPRPSCIAGQSEPQWPEGGPANRRQRGAREGRGQAKVREKTPVA